MKATKKSRQAADFVDVRKNGEGGTTYTCLKCGWIREANAYYEEDYKAMVDHATKCDGQGAPSETRAVQIHPGTDIKALNEHVTMLAGHIKKCIPNGDELTNSEAIALARISMATDLSPFTAEVWYIPKKGPHIGIRGLRRKAKEQALYSKNHRPMTPEEIKEHDVRTEVGDIGYVCELFRHDLTREAAEINQMAGEPVIPIKPIVGIGVWRKAYKEIGQYKDDPVPHGKSPAWVAKKRAEADALFQAYDIGINLPHADEPAGYLEMADIDAEWAVIPDGDEVIRRKATANAERREQVTQVANEASEVIAKYASAPSLDDMVAQYKAGELELPPWVEELREAISAHPKVSDDLGDGNGMIQQLRLSACRTVSMEQFTACVKIICDHPLEDMTFGEAAVLMNKFVNGKDFEAQVIGLLS